MDERAKRPLDERVTDPDERLDRCLTDRLTGFKGVAPLERR